mgnify:CR=1 FL=1
MKNVFACVLRILASYSKFGIMIFSLSLINTALKSENNFRYLNSNSQFLKLGGVYINEEKNIRRNKLVRKYTAFSKGLINANKLRVL